MAIKITKRVSFSHGAKDTGKPPLLGQGIKVTIASNRAETSKKWAKGDQAIVIRRFPYRGVHESYPHDDLYEVQLIAKDYPRLFFTHKELELV